MANEDLPRLRPLANARSDRDDRSNDPVVIPVRDTQTDIREPPADAVGEVTVGVPKEPVESDEERAARERRELIAAADDTEIVDAGISTTAYRRATAVFDEADERLQLAEHYYYRSADYERNGRF